jgi:cytochrome b subunit of formate dehydrogenase
MRKINVIEKKGNLYFQRLTLNQRLQHVVIFLSFTVLAVTGLPLKFHHTWWGEHLYQYVGGIAYAPLIHRVSAVVMTIGFIYHFLYVLACAWKYYLLPLKKRGELSFASGLDVLLRMPMVPNRTDIQELRAALKYFFFLTRKRPLLTAHGLKEKFGYLAVFWGIPVIGASGYFLWGKSFFTRFFSGNVLNFAYIAHSDEALLASIVIFIWHIYNVHLTPAVFPMGKAWLYGFVVEKEMIQYHYQDYLNAMRDAGHADRIKPLRESYVYGGGFLKTFFMKGFLSVMFVAVIISSYYICKVIYESVFVFGYQIVTTELAPAVEPLVQPDFIREIVLEDEEQKTFYRGYRFVQEKKVQDHYHRIELEITPDETSHCIKCHGDLPHGKSEHIRAFLNMHNLYFACQTCHVRPATAEERLQYYWCDRKTGDAVLNPDIADKPIDSLGIRLTPCVTCGVEMDRNTVARERKSTNGIMERIQGEGISRAEKKEIVKQIHEHVSEQPLACRECHTRENPFLPLSKVGYSERRIAQVASDQITKMINEYKEFYTPTFLKPGRVTDEAKE